MMLPLESTEILQLTVSQFADRLRGWLWKRPELRRIAIIGEISDCKPQANGNIYFKLKDDRALLNCFSFSSEAKSFPNMRDGDAVKAIGQVDIWERRSEYQLRVFEVNPFGVGAIAAKVEALRKRLQDEGVFAQARKRSVPRFPLRVALISARGKGTADFEATLRERAPNVVSIFVPIRVEGDGAELDIADGLERASRLDVDAVVLLRGGGSYEARYPFNTEVVVRAIIRSRHPVVTAIGHEGDWHLADDAADAVFKTPTAAAEYIATSWSDARNRLVQQRRSLAVAVETILVRSFQGSDRALDRLTHAARQVSASKRLALNEAVTRLERRSPQRMLGDTKSRLERESSRLTGTAARIVSRKSAGCWEVSHRFARAGERWQNGLVRKLQIVQQALDRCDPLAPLQRGYAIVSKDGHALRDAKNASAGDRITALLQHGTLRAVVESTEQDNDRG